MNSVQSDQSGNEIRRDPFYVATELGHSDIATQEPFIDALKRSQKDTHIRPHPFAGVDVNFADAVAIIIPRPFIISMMDSGMRPNNVIVA